MSTTTLKKSAPERNTGADCPVCKNYRYSINDFCCNCGKRLKDTRVLMNRYAPDWNAGVDCACCQNYRDIGEKMCIRDRCKPLRRHRFFQRGSALLSYHCRHRSAAQCHSGFSPRT